MLTNSQASSELNKMKKSLANWLKWREGLKKIAQGKEFPGKGKAIGRPDFAKKALSYYTPSELKLAQKLEELLYKIEPGEDWHKSTPEEMAMVVIRENVTPEGFQPQAGILPWVVVSGAVIILYGIRTVAEAAEKERQLDACKAGYTDACPGNWKNFVVLGAIGVGGYFFFTKTDLGQGINRKIKDFLGIDE